jgi:hypothetical protein
MSIVCNEHHKWGLSFGEVKCERCRIFPNQIIGQDPDLKELKSWLRVEDYKFIKE